MPVMRIDGREIEIPRHVHKSGESKIVWTVDEFQAAESDGWSLEANQAREAIPVAAEAEFTPEPPAEAPEPVPTGEHEPEPEPDAPVLAEAPVKRPRGRPRKVVEG